MTRDELIGIVFDSESISSCPFPNCDTKTMSCMECAELQVKSYERQVREEFAKKLKLKCGFIDKEIEEVLNEL